MKKVLTYAALAIFTVSVASCRKDDSTENAVIKEPSDIAVQNTQDDQAIVKYMDEHYLDAQGKIQAFTSTVIADATHVKLSGLNPRKLASGVYVITKEGAQPDPGTAIGTTDIIRLMHKTNTFLSNTENGAVVYTSEYIFGNTIEGTGAPTIDPMYYFTSTTTATAAGKPKSYYEIEGFQEGLKYFKSFNKSDADNYNVLQGVIIIPSRAAFARDEHYPYNGVSWRNRNFVFNFQVYKTTPATRN